MIGIGIANAELFASMSRSSSRSLMRSTLRSVDGQTATLHVGERFPVITSGYYGDVPSGEDVYRPPPTVSFEDLGVVLNVTPHVHGTEEITLDVEAEYQVLAGESVNGIPVIANRTFQGTVRLANGEWAIMSGLVRESEMESIAGIAGLSQLPVLGPLFRRNTTEESSRQALLVLRPRLVYAPPAEFSTPEIWTGTETRLRDPL
jgi:general secretion pathway protein D